MQGRLEKEKVARDKMEIKLEKLPPIFTLFYNWMDARDKSYTTMDNYINHVSEFMEFYTKGKMNNKFYETVTDSDIEKYMTWIRRKEIDGKVVEVGDGIRAAKWSSLNTFFKFLSQKKHISNNPMLLTERPKDKTKHNITYMTPKEIESVFKRISEEARPMVKNRDTCIVAMGLGTGLRVSAIVNINVEDIDFKTNSIRVIEKGRKTRDISIQGGLRNLLLIWMKDRELYFEGETTGPLFISQKKSRLSVDSVEELVRKYTNHLSKKITPHKLRSSAAMNLHGAGVDILTIASILGHENVTTTQRYTRAYDEDKTRASKILDGLLGNSTEI
jgi:site-specific recombinase XerD